MSDTEGPLASIRDEAKRILTASRDSNTPLRLVGGLAVAFHIPEGRRSVAPRDYKDIDFVAGPADGRAVRTLLESHGYEPDVPFNSLHGKHRLLYHDRVNGRQLDIFVGAFTMCHTIPIAERLAVHPVTVPLAELLLTKLQIVELNEKDQVDVLNLFSYCEVGDTDDDEINAGVVARLCARDWGLWRTTKLNLDRTRSALASGRLEVALARLVEDRVARLWERVEGERKTTRWRMRNRVGDRAQWYDEPEEVDAR